MTDKTPEGRKSYTMPLNMRVRAKEIWNELVYHMDAYPGHAYQCKLDSEEEHIEQALIQVREETIRECAEIAIEEREKDFPDIRTVRDRIRALLTPRKKSRIEREGK